MPKETVRRRVGVTLVVAVAMAGVMVSAGSASGDPIANKRAEAAKVVAELDALQQKEEIIAEQYDNARVELSTVSGQVTAAKATLAGTQKTLAKRRHEMAGFAVQAYLEGGTDENGSLVLSSSNGTDASQRQGYADATQGRAADMLDQLRSAQAQADNDIANLQSAQAQVSKVEHTMAQKRTQAQAAVAAQQAIYSTVKGQLATLVAQQQAAEAAAKAKAAAAAQAQFLAQQRAFAASHPSAPRPADNVVNDVGAGTGSHGTTSSADNSSSGSGGSGGAPFEGGVAPSGSGAATAIAAAEAEIGVRYTWAGASPATGFDCSGLMMWAWAHAGVSLPHSSSGQYAVSQHIPLDEIQPGDLLFYGSPIHHVAMYIGGGQIIQAPHTGANVGEASMYYGGNIVGAGRV